MKTVLQHLQAPARFLVRGFDNPIIAATTVSDNVRKLQTKRPIYFAFFGIPFSAPSCHISSRNNPYIPPRLPVVV